MRFRLVVPAFALFLAGCAADVTFFIDIHRNGTAVATTREVMDDELYRLALRQNVAGDPFSTERMQGEGWSVSRTTDQNGNHVITMSKALSRDDFNGGGKAMPALRGVFLPISSLEVSRSRGFFVEQDSLSATVPALLPLVQSQLRVPYGDLAAAMLGAAVALHFQLRTPGTVLETNGEKTTSGFVRWDLSLEAPTKVRYTVRVVRVDRIVIISIALAALILTLRVVQRRVALRLRSG